MFYFKNYMYKALDNRQPYGFICCLRDVTKEVLDKRLKMKGSFICWLKEILKKGSKVLSADGEGLSAPENFRTI